MTDHWTLTYRGFDPEEEGLREALCTLGNGVFATRGAAAESRADGVHYPGNYVAGGYNELASEVAGRTVVNEDLVNFPNWLWLNFRADDGKWLDLNNMDVLDYRQDLNLRDGLLRREFRVRDSQGRITSIKSRRLVHMKYHHLAAIQWRLTPENWSGAIEVESGLDGAVTNENVERYQQLESKHLDVINAGTVAPEGIFLKVRTNQSDAELAQAARTRVSGIDEVRLRRWIDEDHPEKICERLRFRLEKGQPAIVEKVVAQFTSRDRGIGDCGKRARLAAGDAPDFEALASSQRAAWAQLWWRSDVEIDVVEDEKLPDYDQLVLRLHIFHLLQTASLNTVGRDVGIPARGLHGEAYRGHIFWDELFILPFYILRLPSVARSTILYRYYRLDSARKMARQDGFEGACFPWQSGSDGLEATQELHLNPMSGKWDPDYSHLQRHINSAIVYNIWQYYEATGDRAFVEEYGAEIVLEIARFWSSIAHFNADTDRFEIHGVMGPDEYHEKYPDADRGGLKNNVYTNITAVWCLLRAMDILQLLGEERRIELREMLDIDDADLSRWEEITRRMTVVFHDGVMSQFEGYEELDEFDWQGYAEKYDNIERLDRILKAEGDSPDHYKASKQADVTMLLYLFQPPELRALLARLGYELSDEDVMNNVTYYRARTSHGSTLSRVVYTSVVHRHDCEEGARLFLSALESDICDVQGGTTPEGIHLGAMAGTVDIVKRYYAGLKLSETQLHFSPHMPQRVQRLRFRVRHRLRWYDVELTQDVMSISVDRAEEREVMVSVNGKEHTLNPGETIEVDIEHSEELHYRLDEEKGLAPTMRYEAEENQRCPPGQRPEE